MLAALPAADNGTMTTYAVLWRYPRGSTYAGALVFEPERLMLNGASRSGARRDIELAYSEIEEVTVGRAPGERIDGRASLVLDLHGGNRLLVTSATGAGMNHDIAEQLVRRRVGVGRR